MVGLDKRSVSVARGGHKHEIEVVVGVMLGDLQEHDTHLLLGDFLIGLEQSEELLGIPGDLDVGEVQELLLLDDMVLREDLPVYCGEYRTLRVVVLANLEVVRQDAVEAGLIVVRYIKFDLNLRHGFTCRKMFYTKILAPSMLMQTPANKNVAYEPASMTPRSFSSVTLFSLLVVHPPIALSYNPTTKFGSL